jgi:serine/threonine-protein kinase RsbW
MLLAFVDIAPISQKVVLESKLKSVEEVNTLISRLRTLYYISESKYNDMWVVLNEAVSNAIIHGNRFSDHKKIRLSVEMKEERYLCFVVKDEGAGFNPDLIPDPTSPERISMPNGRGIYLMKKLADEVNITEGGTVVEMIFDLYKC